MIARNPDQRIAVLVDVQNLYYSARNLYESRISFKNLLEEVVQDRVLIRAIAYVIEADANKGEKEFFDALNNAGFEVKEKPLQVFYDGAKKGDWDIGMAMDAIRLGNKVDSVVLVSGDGDFRPVVNYLQQALGCLVEVVAFKSSANKELIEIADDFVNIEDNKAKLLFKARKVVRRPRVGSRPSKRSTSRPASRPSASKG